MDSTNIYPLLKQIKNPGICRAVTFNNKNIKVIGDNAFGSFHSLLYVNLEKNRITKISPSAFTGTMVLRLSLSLNSLICIPDLRSIKISLQELNLDANKLGLCQIRTRMCNTTYALRRLSLSSNGLTHLPRLVFCSKNLKYLNLVRNKLKLYQT